jgi:hypothetical protein
MNLKELTDLQGPSVAIVDCGFRCSLLACVAASAAGVDTKEGQVKGADHQLSRAVAYP